MCLIPGYSFQAALCRRLLRTIVTAPANSMRPNIHSTQGEFTGADCSTGTAQSNVKLMLAFSLRRVG